MSITSDEIKELLDSNASKRETITILTNWMLVYPGEFWPAISYRMLGKKRMSELERFGLLAARSENKLEKLCGEYLIAMLNAKAIRHGEVWQKANLTNWTSTSSTSEYGSSTKGGSSTPKNVLQSAAVGSTYTIPNRWIRWNFHADGSTQYAGWDNGPVGTESPCSGAPRPDPRPAHSDPRPEPVLPAVRGPPATFRSKRGWPHR